MGAVSRQEKKFLISYSEFRRCDNMFEKVLISDKHNKDMGYLIRSLYFDSIYDRDFNEKESGTEIRRKIRLRIYDANQKFATLEMKQKNGENQLKRGVSLTREDAIALINGDYSVLLKYDDFAIECYGLMNMYCYKPKTVVQYNRKAYIAKENNIRLTFDFNIKGSETNFNIFDENLLLNDVFDKDKVVFEVKYNHFMLSYVKNLLEQIEKSEVSVSKYCLCRASTKNYIFM